MRETALASAAPRYGLLFAPDLGTAARRGRNHEGEFLPRTPRNYSADSADVSSHDLSRLTDGGGSDGPSACGIRGPLGARMSMSNMCGANRLKVTPHSSLDQACEGRPGALPAANPNLSSLSPPARSRAATDGRKALLVGTRGPSNPRPGLRDQFSAAASLPAPRARKSGNTLLGGVERLLSGAAGSLIGWHDYLAWWTIGLRCAYWGRFQGTRRRWSAPRKQFSPQRAAPRKLLQASAATSLLIRGYDPPPGTASLVIMARN